MSFLNRLERAEFSPVRYLLIVNLAMFAWSMWASRRIDWVIPAPQFGPSGAVLTWSGSSQLAAILVGEWWRAFGSMFLHANLLHIAFNMFALYSFGTYMTLLSRGWTFTNAYLISGLTGVLGSLLWQGYRHGVVAAPGSIGASGAVFGLGGYLFGRFHGSTDPGAQQVRRQLVFWLLANFAIGAQIPRIDHAGHIGGFIGGFIVARLGGGGIGSGAARLLRSGRLGMVLVVLAAASLAATIWNWHGRREEPLVTALLFARGYQVVQGNASVADLKEAAFDLGRVVDEGGRYAESAKAFQRWLNYELEIRRGDRSRDGETEEQLMRQVAAADKLVAEGLGRQP
ncbi:MAG: rhomboid family intramembrane serine protease [Planctomycetes bacterium]|nr:rhomboid family intramembrane serine protease [Planctomycetota bacterium]